MARHVAQHDILVVVCKASRCGIRAADDPAATKGCDPGLQLSLKGRRNCSHWVFPHSPLKVEAPVEVEGDWLRSDLHERNLRNRTGRKSGEIDLQIVRVEAHRHVEQEASSDRCATCRNVS